MSWGELFDRTEAAEKKDVQYANIPNGEYSAVLDTYKIDESKEPARLSLTWKLATDDDFDGRYVFSTYQLNEKGIPFLKKDLRTLGVDEPKANTLTKTLTNLCGVEALVGVKQRPHEGKMYYNVFVNDLAERAATKSTSFDKDEEIPF